MNEQLIAHRLFELIFLGTDNSGLIDRLATFPLSEIIWIAVNAMVHRVAFDRFPPRLNNQLFDVVHR